MRRFKATKTTSSGQDVVLYKPFQSNWTYCTSQVFAKKFNMPPQYCVFLPVANKNNGDHNISRPI